jgi:Ca-activated chloride channel homolog
MSRGMARVLVTVGMVAALALPARGASDLPGRIGMYPAHGAPLAMLDSDVAIRVRGPIVEATVTQTFRNDTDRVVEATYIFPLPHDAAVSAMHVEVGSRTIRAAIEPRERARQRYEAAVSAGLGAGLLEQERPDVFTQTVSTIPARGTVKVTLRYDTVARYQAGSWELVVPLVVAPRYVPGVASGRPTTGTGRAPDTDRAPDASRVTPGGEPGAGGRTDVTLELADAEDVTSPTHELAKTRTGFAFTDPRTDHDAVIRWRSKAAQHAWVEPDRDGGYAAVLVEAKPAAGARKAAVRVQLVLDHVATTRGDGATVQRPLVRSLLAELGARDSVAVGTGDKLAFGTPAAAQRAVDDLLAAPSKTAFDLTRVLGGLRGTAPVVLVTDGLVADDRAAIAAAGKARSPIHVIGIGPAPNRSLLVAIAHASGGTVRFALASDELPALARDVLADVASPPERVAISWGTLAASDVVPAHLPRLGAGQALLVLARVKQVQAANARARGDVFGFTTLTSPIAPPGATTAGGPLARRWARQRLDDLIANGAGDKAIAEHALRHGLVSPATAMVAIGDEVISKGGVKHTVPVPVSVPAGMQWQRVKQQTTVDITVAQGGEDQDKAARAREPVAPPREPVAKPPPTPPREPVAAKPKSTPHREPVASAPAQPRSAPPRDFAAARTDDDAEEPDSPGRAAGSLAVAPSAAYDFDDELVVESISTRGYRRALRLSVGLGAGVAITGGERSGP